MTEKSYLQVRAEQALHRFKQDARRPIVIEFAGVPKAGKTSTIAHVRAFLKRCGFRVRVVVERASVCPIRDKKHPHFNVWTAVTTLAQILESTQDPPRFDDPHILILDRGIFDSVCWFRMMDRLSRIRTADREIIEQFLLLPEWQKRITGVVVMTAAPEDAMKREAGYLPVQQAEGSIMNTEVLRQVLDTTKQCVEALKDRFKICEIDTSDRRTKDSPKAVAEAVADRVLSWIEEDLQEDILFLPKTRIKELFGKNISLTG